MMQRPNLNNITPDEDILKQLRWMDWISPAGGVLMVVLMLLLPSLMGSNFTGAFQLAMTFTFMWVALASSWNLIGGYTGYTDLGHTVFFGIGGYTAGILMAHLADKEILPPMPFPIAVVVAAVVSALFALIVGYPTLRLRGSYFAIAMLSMFVAVRQITLNLKELTNGGEGITFRAPFLDPNDGYVMFLFMAAGVFFFSLWLYRSQFGKVLRAIKDDEMGADMRGVDTTRIKLVIFATAAGITGVLGAMRAYQNSYIEPSIIFQDGVTAQMIMMSLLGGIGRPWGPVYGAGLLRFGQLAIWANLPPVFHLIITGGLLIGLVLFLPRGLLGVIDREGRGLRWIVASWLTRRRLSRVGTKEQVTA